MSGFIGGAQSQPLIWADDQRAFSPMYAIDWNEMSPIAMRCIPTFDYTTPYWPGGSSFMADADPFSTDIDMSWGRVEQFGGTTSRYAVSGVTRDVYGSPLGGVTVKMFRTSTDEMVGTTVSDPAGAYLVSTPYYPDTHYLVFYKAGFPDVFGTSVNTINGG
jgi:hypothetical protein